MFECDGRSIQRIVRNLLDTIPYDEPTSTAIELPERQSGTYTRPPMAEQTFVTDHSS